MCENSADAEPSGVENSPKPIKFIIGDIVERRVDGTSSAADSIVTDIDMEQQQQSVEAFPVVNRLDEAVKAEQPANSKLSLFALSQLRKANKPMPMEVSSTVPTCVSSVFGHSSHILRNDKNNEIHKENVEFLKNHSEAEILREQQKLLDSMGMYMGIWVNRHLNSHLLTLNVADPSIVKFLRQKRKHGLEEMPEKEPASKVSAPLIQPDSDNSALPDLDIFHHDGIKKWLHFDVVETEKLQWMRDLPANLPELKPGESYEAR